MKSKKSISVLFFCGALLLTSCLPSEFEINPLTGTWTLKGVSCQNCIDKTQITSTTFSCNDTGCNTYTFNEDGTLKLVDTSSGTIETTFGNYSISGSIVNIHLNDETSSVRKYSFNLNGSMLYLIEIVDKGTGKCGSTTVLAK
ncbi:MAG TPA: lipocalin family protein [Chryseolinea sp.]|nr:lipocalin family protein [Chryseolinea sp.]